nr:hypothetical protein CFP56_63818 [Quercus suber]
MVPGDNNTKYFHNRASQCFCHNSISELRDSNGLLVTGEEHVSAMAEEYYSKLFSSSNPRDMDVVVQHTKRVIIKSLPLCIAPQSDSLVWPAKKNGLFSVKTGYNALFRDWQVVGNETDNGEAYRSLWKSVWKLKVLGPSLRCISDIVARQYRAVCWGVLLWVGQRVIICSCVCCGGQDRQSSGKLDRVIRDIRFLTFGTRAGLAMVQETRYSLLSDSVLLVQQRLDDHASTMEIIQEDWNNWIAISEECKL